MKFIDLFAGIGGFRRALESNGHECVGYVEKDKFALNSYQAIHNTANEWFREDITEISNEEFAELKGKVDIITGGFPCIAFSSAGKRLGFKDSTNGTLFFDVIRAVENIQPKIVFLENVKGLVNHDNGNTLKVMIGALTDLGYTIDYKLFNSKYFNVPQNRERIFIIATKNYVKNWYLKDIVDANQSVNKHIIDILEPNTDENDIVHNENTTEVLELIDLEKLTTYSDNLQKLGNIYNSKGQNGNIYSPLGISPTVSSGSTTTKGNGGVGSNNAPKIVIYTKDKRYIRKLTALECWKLQGFSKQAYIKAHKVTSKTQLYKQAGNSVTVEVIKEISKHF